MKAILIIFFLLISGVTTAQRFVRATATPWAGGVCCVHGIRYAVEIEIDDSFDYNVSEVWLKDQPDKMDFQMQRVNDSVAVIHFGVSFDDRSPALITESSEIDPPTIQGKPSFEGEAFIILVNNIKEINISIDSFALMPAIAYP